MDISNDLSVTIGLGALAKDKEEEQSALRITTRDKEGDTVDISGDAYEKLAESTAIAATSAGESEQADGKGKQSYMRIADGSEGEETEKTAEEKLLEALEEKIEKLEEEIRELRQGNLPEEQKEKLIAQKEAELALLQHQLLEARRTTSEGGGGYRGGTRAEGGLGSSLT